MGSQREDEKVKEKLETYRYIIDSAYVLFDKKYTMHELETMPYKELIYRIEREQRLMKEHE